MSRRHHPSFPIPLSLPTPIPFLLSFRLSSVSHIPFLIFPSLPFLSLPLRLAQLRILEVGIPTNSHSSRRAFNVCRCISKSRKKSAAVYTSIGKPDSYLSCNFSYFLRNLLVRQDLIPISLPTNATSFHSLLTPSRSRPLTFLAVLNSGIEMECRGTLGDGVVVALLLVLAEVLVPVLPAE